MYLLPRALQTASEAQLDRRHGQLNLFEAIEAETPAEGPVSDSLPTVPEWPAGEKLKYEKEALDFYISSHPLAQYEGELRRFSTHDTSQLRSLDAGQEVVIGGMLTLVRFQNTKKARNGNSRYARFKLEDFAGLAECVM